MDRNERILEEYKNGLTLREIGEICSLSRQRVWQILAENGFRRDRECRKPSLRFSEMAVKKKAQSLGCSVSITPYNYPYDLVINDKKVEVKFRSKASDGRYYHFTHLRNGGNPDFYIFVVGELKNPTYYICPTSFVLNHVSIPVRPKFKTRRERKYRNNWELLKRKDVLDKA